MKQYKTHLSSLIAVLISLSANGQVWKYGSTGDTDFQGTNASTYMKRCAIEAKNGDLSKVYNKFISPKVLTKEEAEKITYWWQDPATGEWHESNLTEKATHPAQIMELLAKVYTDPNIPGTRFPDPRQHSASYDSLLHQGLFKSESTSVSIGVSTGKTNKITDIQKAKDNLIDSRDYNEIALNDVLQRRDFNNGPRFFETMYTLNGVKVACNLGTYTGSTTIKQYDAIGTRNTQKTGFRISTPFPNDVLTCSSENASIMTTTMPYSLNSGWGASQLMREVYTGNVSTKNQWEHYDEVKDSDKKWISNKHTYITPFDHGYTVLLVKTRKDFDWNNYADKITYNVFELHSPANVYANGAIEKKESLSYQVYNIQNITKTGQKYNQITCQKDDNGNYCFKIEQTSVPVSSGVRLNYYTPETSQITSGSKQFGTTTTTYNEGYTEEMWLCYDYDTKTWEFFPRSMVEANLSNIDNYKLSDDKIRLFYWQSGGTKDWYFYDFDITTEGKREVVYVKPKTATTTPNKPAIMCHDYDYMNQVCTGPYKDTYGLKGMEYADALYLYNNDSENNVNPEVPSYLYEGAITSVWKDPNSSAADETTTIYPNMYRGDAYLFIGECFESVELMTDFELVTDLQDQKEGWNYWKGNGDPYLEGKNQDSWSEKASSDQYAYDAVLNHSYNPGIMYNIYENDMSRMHIIAKGSSAINDEWDMPFYGMFETFSPSQPKTSSTAYDNLVYNAENYHVTHDCPRVEGNDHDLKFMDNLGTSMRDVDLNFGFFIPHFRYEYYENMIDGYNAEKSAGEYSNDNIMRSRQSFVRYNPNHRPYFFCYGVKQKEPTAELVRNKETGKNQYKVTITWTPMNFYVDNSIATEYYVYEVKDGVVQDSNGPIRFVQLKGDEDGTYVIKDENGNNVTKLFTNVTATIGDTTYDDISAVISRGDEISAQFYIDQPKDTETRTYVVWANVITDELLVDGKFDESKLTNFNQVQSNSMSVILGGNEILNLKVNNSDESYEHSYGDDVTKVSLTWLNDDQMTEAHNEYCNELELSNDRSASQCMTLKFIKGRTNPKLTVYRKDRYDKNDDSKTVQHTIATLSFSEAETGDYTDSEGKTQQIVKHPFTITYGEDGKSGVPSGATTNGFMFGESLPATEDDEILDDNLIFEVVNDGDDEISEYITFRDIFNSDVIPNHADRYTYIVTYTADDITSDNDSEDSKVMFNSGSNDATINIYQPEGIITPHHFETEDVINDYDRSLKYSNLKYAYFPFKNRVDLTNYTVYHGNNQVARIDKLPTIVKTMSFHGMDDIDESEYKLNGSIDYVNKYYKDHSLSLEDYYGIARIPIYTPNNADYNKYKIVVKTDRDGTNSNTYGSAEMHCESADISLVITKPSSEQQHYQSQNTYDKANNIYYQYVTWDVPGTIKFQMPDATYSIDDAKMRIWRTVTVYDNLLSTSNDDKYGEYTDLVYSDFEEDKNQDYYLNSFQSTKIITDKLNDSNEYSRSIGGSATSIGDSKTIDFIDKLVFDQGYVSYDMNVSYTARLYSYTETRENALLEEFKTNSPTEVVNNQIGVSNYINELNPVGLNGYLIDDQTDTIEMQGRGDTGDGDIKTGATEIEQEQIYLKVYPNPTESDVTINAEGIIEIYNSVGVLMTRIDDGMASRSLNVSHFSPGIYLVKCGSKCSRLIKR